MYDAGKEDYLRLSQHIGMDWISNMYKRLAMGKVRNCVVRNAEGKMRNGMCGATVIGHDVAPRDGIYSAFHCASIAWR